MTKPKFGKWTSTKDVPVPKELDVIVIEKGINSSYMGIIEDEEEGLRWSECDWTDIDNITHWMPCPSVNPEQDAFTELRALLDEAEKDNREKYPDESMMTSILQRMREVIE